MAAPLRKISPQDPALVTCIQAGAKLFPTFDTRPCRYLLVAVVDMKTSAVVSIGSRTTQVPQLFSNTDWYDFPIPTDSWMDACDVYVSSDQGDAIVSVSALYPKQNVPLEV